MFVLELQQQKLLLIVNVFLLFGVSSLECLAHNIQKEGYICSLIDAKHDNVYAGFFNISYKDGALQTIKSNYAFLDLKDKNGNLTADSLVSFIKNSFSNADSTSNTCKTPNISIDENNNLINCPIYFVGDAANLYEDLLKNLNINGCKNIIASREIAVCSSITIAKVGYTKYKNGDFGDSTILSPLYLRKSQAELALNCNK